MAHRSYSKSFGPAEHEHEALWIVEDLIDDLHRPDSVDVGEIERHVGLEIGPDGTVKSVGSKNVIKHNYEGGLSVNDQALYSEEAERLRNKVAEELYNDLPVKAEALPSWMSRDGDTLDISDKD